MKPESRLLNPALEGIEQRCGRTKVHLQVYGGKLWFFRPRPTRVPCLTPYMPDCAHALPILFAFTTPGKYCFRAMATRPWRVCSPRPSADAPVILENENRGEGGNRMTLPPESTQLNFLHSTPTAQDSREQVSHGAPPRLATSRPEPLMPSSSASSPPLVNGAGASKPSSAEGPTADRKKPKRSTLGACVSRASGFLRRRQATADAEVPSVPGASSPTHRPHHEHSSPQLPDVGGPRWQFHRSSADPLHLYAGDADVRDNGLAGFFCRPVASPLLGCFRDWV